jgi:pilus assembly protein Flp/PilA
MSGKTSPSDEGATAVEYGLMLSLIFMVILAAVTLLGGELAAAFANAAALI